MIIRTSGRDVPEVRRSSVYNVLTIDSSQTARRKSGQCPAGWTGTLLASLLSLFSYQINARHAKQAIPSNQESRR